ncbi:MAG: NAD-dependent DNA ligase LigA [Eubacteriales bacterium]|nr:NAD-dependent DNA ligase LigA [Eubacteriales bacterium]
MERIRELIDLLNKASLAYYQEGREIMPNIEYDALYDELLRLEKETGMVMDDSPTQNVGYKVVSELPKERHAAPMLSLDKTKSVDDLGVWLGDKQGVLSWKLDGLTVVLTYNKGKLIKAITRGNGEIGEVITGNAYNFENIPVNIDYDGELVLRGEAIITYSDFEKINEEISDADAKYKNPRNLCSGSVRQLDPKVTKQRHVRCVIFSLVSGSDIPVFSERFEWLKGLGFETVEYVITDAGKIHSDVEVFKKKIETNDFPSDGLVLTFEDIKYGESLGRTAKFPRNAIAFKWQDETAETTLKEIEWSASRTGLINPVAIFDPVELEGTTVSRASVHNISIVEELKLGIGDTIRVYKANMIIPQISENLTGSGTVTPPERCPVCGGRTEIRQDRDAKYLFCNNPECPAKKIKSFSLIVSRDALNIDGMSEATLEKFISQGFIHEFADLFSLGSHRDEISSLEGFGEKSADNIINAAEKARKTEMHRFIYGLGINGIGLANAKLISKYYDCDYEKIKNASLDELKDIDKIGPVLAKNFTEYFMDMKKRLEADRLFEVLEFSERESDGGEQVLAGKTFVITGDVHIFKNRREVQEKIEALGGKTAGSVSSKTDYLINNDILSGSSKNKKAKELNIPIITEEEFISMYEN